ncbi:hypothetical protein P691DRAFT_425927 [Macrolepiota fuliginosa MF-IS2]|uniref:2'-phosphotransferase n=1 Tax=Macrolepiota fuliginosa MF-IS2 TaxID=1400762 RepID=A0A9P6BZ68_9AGAR|nr:hypothetical protein P691DRAFT_425927 [Macrolepiota fuliginosa MF-IS2]
MPPVTSALLSFATTDKTKTEAAYTKGTGLPGTRKIEWKTSKCGLQMRLRVEAVESSADSRDKPGVRYSKTLSSLLRHGAAPEGLAVRVDGYVKVNDLVHFSLLFTPSMDACSSRVAGYSYLV